jgi:hypothetical protein
MFRTALLPLFLATLALMPSCRGKSQETSTGAPGVIASAAAESTASKPKPRSVISEAEVQRLTNPGASKPYAGPTGTVAGIVRATGDVPPPLEMGEAKIPLGKCFDAHKMYKTLFREGADRALADVLVAVTGYDGYLPPPTENKEVTAKGCAFDRRTESLMFGQSLRIVNRGGDAVTPQLLGARTSALLVAIPGGDPITVYPQKIGLHKLVDRSHEFSFVDVYVVPYPTTDVTELDGRFEIRGVPVGEVTVNALLPATGKTADTKVSVEANKTAELTLEIAFDAKQMSAPPLTP